MSQYIKNFAIPHNLTAEQADAVLSFLYRLEEAIWDCYEDQLLPLMMEQNAIEAHEEEMRELSESDFLNDIPY